MAEFFRFRSIDALLGKYQELEKQTIYFASPEELNDPIEGFRDIVWNGDKIAWTNLFKHYTLCLHRVFFMFRIIGGSEELNVRNIPILDSQDELLTPQEKDLFNSIWQKFFNVSKIEEIVEAIANTRRKIRYREIICYLQTIHFILLETIRKLHITRGLMSESEMPQLLSEELIAASVEVIFKTVELTEAVGNDQQLDIFWKIQTRFDDNRRLMQQYNRRKIFNGISNEILKKNNELVIFDFPKVYVENLKNLPFHKWWTACFTESYDNLSVWGNYADGHKGACLIFEDNLNWKSVKYQITDFHKVNYENKLTELDFFRSIGTGTKDEIMETWYTDEDGNRSECASHIGDESEDTWRKDYWDSFFRIITTKNKDWEYEQEYRIILHDIIRGVVQQDDRTLTYDFNSLKGIIFGMRTSIEDKLKIIDIIKSKCAENDRTDFKFFEAYYSPEQGDICKYEIPLRLIEQIADSQKFAEAYHKHRFTQNKKADYERAIVNFTKAIERDPEDVMAHNNRGVIYYNKGRFYRAVDDFSKAISLTPDDPFAYYGRGLAYRNLLVFEKSIQDFSTAISLKPEAAADAYTERGITYHSKGDIDKAIEDYNAAIALEPGFAEAWTERGKAYRDKGEIGKAIENYNKAIELNPELAAPYTCRGLIYTERGELENAIADHSKALACNPEFAEAYVNRGQAYYAKNELNKAIEDYGKAIELNPELVEAYTHRGNTYRAKAELDSAIADYTEALKLRPKIPEFYYTRGEAWLLAKGWEEAKTDLTAALLQDVDVAAAFHNTHGSIAAFEEKIRSRLPKDIVELLTPRSEPFEIDKDARIALGMKYYGNDELSSGLASKLAGIPRMEFIFLMGDYGLSPFGDEEEYAKSGF